MTNGIDHDALAEDRICKACAQSHPISDFYQRSGKPWLYEWKCKRCYNDRLNAARRTDEFRQDRRDYLRNARNSQYAKAREIRHAATRYEKFPERAKAHQAVARALATGKMVGPEECETCRLAAPNADGGGA
jgi:hypothetical protein